MKFIHTGDLHLDSKIDSLPIEKSKIKREEVLSSFEKLCKYASDNNVTAVLICGDLFDSDKISNKTALRVLSAIQSANNVDFLYLKGNHDEFDFFENFDGVPQNFKFFNDDWTTFIYGDTAITGKNFNKKNTSSHVETLFLQPNKKNIVCLHGLISDYKAKDESEIISLPKLKNKGIDYLALGHLHAFLAEDLDSCGQYAYCGCLEGRGFDELGEKGFVLLEIENKKLSSTFVPFSSRNFYSFEFNLDMSKNFYENTDEFIDNLQEKIDNKSILKIILKGEIIPDYNIDTNYLENKLNEKFFYAKVEDKTQVKIDLNDYLNDKSIVGEFVRAVYAENLEKEMMDKVLLLGLNALNKKEI